MWHDKNGGYEERLYGKKQSPMTSGIMLLKFMTANQSNFISTASLMARKSRPVNYP